jgi:hypothetical protein
MDERFKMHRFYSTRFAVIVASLFMAGWYYYDYFVNDMIKWDLVIILSVMAVSKIGAMIYYRITH